ncbi:DUF2075 domain-containing protein [Macrococcus brunensis]|uniref:DUF2075 domain-containing protein n=1 Tax=Macrococcus brunensis TaxID=198483 RepID=UPI001EF087FF|nr:DUF2075 domain-containing protein [Macrococcus brunensis]ULG71498.1 DUF2075 domain-containing protein [Macrococcus brunensis]
MGELKIEVVDFNKNALKQINDPLLDRYPIVYILNDSEPKPTAYIGQTVQVKNRMANHLKNPERKKLDKMILIGHEKFNQSATYNIETNLINYFIADNHYKLQNRSQISQMATHNYYEKETFHSTLFEELWLELQKEKLVKHSLEVLRNRDVFKLSPFKELSTSQLELKEMIIDFCKQNINNNRKAVFLIKGDAGTGKSVVLSSTFNTIQDLAKDKQTQYYDHSLQGTNNYLLVNHNEMLKTYHSIAESLPNLKKNNFQKPTIFLNKMKRENKMADITFVDEAHLLLSREDNFNGFTDNNQLEEIIKHSKVTVIVYDERQYLKIKSHWSDDLLKRITKNVYTKPFTLTDQFRMQASDEIIEWIDAFVERKIQPLPPQNDETFEFKVFDYAGEMKRAIEEKDRKYKLSRIVSTFDYEHKKDGADYYIKEPGFEQVWNRTDYKNTWAEEPETINEVGSIYTIQGFDLNYVGVILGPSVGYDSRTHSLKIDIKQYKDREAFRGESGATKQQNPQQLKEQIVLNSINVLMKRGVKGLYIYASNEELRKVLMNGGRPLESGNHKTD